MARTAVATQEMARTGLTISFTNAIADGHKFVAEAGLFLLVKNDSAGAINVTVQTPATAGDSLAIGDLTVSIPAGEQVAIGPFRGADLPLYEQDDGYIYVDYAAITSMSIAVIEV